jgi:hypothetical protein
VQKSLRGNRRLSYAFRVAAIGQIRNERGNGWACLDQKVAEWTGNTIGRVRIDTARSVVLARRARAVVYALAIVHVARDLEGQQGHGRQLGER